MLNLENSIYKTSRFAHLFKKGENIQLLHSVIMKPFFLDTESLEIFNQFKNGASLQGVKSDNPKSEELIDHLISERLIYPIAFDETAFLRNWVKEVANPSGLLIAYILPTDECNFGCKYCFIEENFCPNHHFTMMNEDTAKKGIDFFAKNLSQNKEIKPELIFYGGEPLLNAEVVLKSINYAKMNYPKIELSMVTNGSKITKEIAKNLIKNNVNVGISLDGPREIHDSMRMFPSGRGTYNQAVRGYNLLKEEGCSNLGISFTLGSHNIPDLKGNIEKLCEELNPSSFGFNFMLDTPLGANPLGMDMVYTTEKVIEAFKFLRERGIYEDRIMRKLKPFVKGTLHVKDCGAPGNQIVIAPNGDIGPCQGFLSSNKYFTMNLDKSPILEKDESFNYWKERYPINIDECLDCEALGICGGGCPYNAYLTKGDIWSLDDRLCKHNKLFLDWLLWDLYDSKSSKE